jgi:hypothetical protein
MISRQLYKVPSYHEIEYQKRSIYKEVHKERDFMKEWTEYFKDNPRSKDESQEDFQKRLSEWMQARTEEINTIISERQSKLESDFRAKQNTQRKIAMNISRISPSSILRYATMNLAQTGIESHERFLRSVTGYKEIFAKYANDIRYKNLFNRNRERQEAQKIDLSDMPKFEYRGETLAESFNKVILDYMLLIIFSILFFVLAYFSFMKYDVR